MLVASRELFINSFFIHVQCSVVHVDLQYLYVVHVRCTCTCTMYIQFTYMYIVCTCIHVQCTYVCTCMYISVAKFTLGDHFIYRFFSYNVYTSTYMYIHCMHTLLVHVHLHTYKLLHMQSDEITRIYM